MLSVEASGWKTAFAAPDLITLITAGQRQSDRPGGSGLCGGFFYFILIDFPIFNVADCYVTVATAILLILLMKVYSDERSGGSVAEKRRESLGEAALYGIRGTGGSAD